MSRMNFMQHAALFCGLTLAGAGFAQATPPVDLSGITPEQREATRAARQAERAAMTPEQRAAAQAGGGRGGAQQGRGTMARDGSGTGGQYGKGGGQEGGGRRGGR